MVDLRQLFDDPNVAFVAARKFTMRGDEFVPGDIVPNAVIRDVRNREAILRSHRVIPVTDDLKNVPRAFRKDIKDRQLLFQKLGLSDVELYDVTNKTIPVAQEALAIRPSISQWAYALACEVTATTPRVTLVTFIKAGQTPAPIAADIEAFVKADASYLANQPLQGFTKADVVAAAYPA